MTQSLPVRLTSEERQSLLDLTRSGKHNSRVVTRAQILLYADKNGPHRKKQAKIGALLESSVARVSRTCRAFSLEGMHDALYDRPRTGAPPKITGDIEAKMVLLACSDPPEGYKRWTLRLIAEQMVSLGYVDSLSNVAVYKRLKKNEIKPWQVKSWCIARPSAGFVAKMEDVLDVYARPYDPAYPVVCLDEALKELHDTPNGTLPLQPGQPVRQDYVYEKGGVAHIFLAVEPLVGKRRVWVRENHTQLELAEILKTLVLEDYPNAEKVVLVTDNLATHTPAALYKAFDPELAHQIASKLEWHYTPEHASWLDMAEIELSALATQCLNRRIPNSEVLDREVQAWSKKRNTQQVRINWQFRTPDARIKLRRLYPEIKPRNLVS